MERARYPFLFFLTLSFVLIFTACGAKNNAVSPSPSASASSSASPAAGGGTTKEVTIHGSNFKWDHDNLQFNVGDTVKMTLIDDEGPHALEIPDLNVNLKSGESATFKVDKAGTFPYNCSVVCGSGHANMTGTITVQ